MSTWREGTAWGQLPTCWAHTEGSGCNALLLSTAAPTRAAFGDGSAATPVGNTCRGIFCTPRAALPAVGSGAAHACCHSTRSKAVTGLQTGNLCWQIIAVPELEILCNEALQELALYSLLLSPCIIDKFMHLNNPDMLGNRS